MGIPEKLSFAVAHCEHQNYLIYLPDEERYKLSELGEFILEGHRNIVRQRKKHNGLNNWKQTGSC